jgi:hypothetical protein
MNLEVVMTNINTQLNLMQLNVAATSVVPKQSNEEAVVSNGANAEFSKTTVTLSDDAKSVTQEAETEGFGNYQPFTTLIRLSADKQDEIYKKEYQEYVVDTKHKANNALYSLNKELVRLQHKIEAIRPEMLGKKWDFVLSDGKIEITGSNLSEKDKQWLENSLNRNKNVVSAVNDFYASVVKSSEHTQEHPSAIFYENDKNKFAYGVADQIDGKLQLKSIMDQAMKKNSSVIGVVQNPFFESINIAQGYLKTSSESVYSFNMADMSDPTTAAYVNTHPNQSI